MNALAPLAEDPNTSLSPISESHIDWTRDAAEAAAIDASAYVRSGTDGQQVLHLMVSGADCFSCIRDIENAVQSSPTGAAVQFNFSTKRLILSWPSKQVTAAEVIAPITKMGYRLAPFDPEILDQKEQDQQKELVKALAVTAFASMNVMLLSVSVWAGWNGGMGEATRHLFHLLSAIISTPAVIYGGRPFYRSAWNALKHRRMNLDVPIATAVILATAQSLHAAYINAPIAYFDASVSLLALLLAGRILDRQARARARRTATHLMALTAKGAQVLNSDGSIKILPLSQLKVGMELWVAVGDRIPADGHVVRGTSEVDMSLVTGESIPQTLTIGSKVFAGTLNQTGPLVVMMDVEPQASLLAEIVRLMEMAEQGQSRYVRLADRLSRWYAPLVHGLALATFLLWYYGFGSTWDVAAAHAIATLVITCPCALGLAVPVVQVIAHARLMKMGILVKSADALERLAAVNQVVFDKTGTLTMGKPTLLETQLIRPTDLVMAAALARSSRHPLAQALVKAAPLTTALPEVTEVREIPGQGLEGKIAGQWVRLGKGSWVGKEKDTSQPETALHETWLKVGEHRPVGFYFTDPLRPNSTTAILDLKERGLKIALLSGDQKTFVQRVGEYLGIDQTFGEMTPTEKFAWVTEHQPQAKILMVGDGLNDAPAIKAADVSISPSSASEVTQNAADIVFLGDGLEAIPQVLAIAQRTQGLVRQNVGLSLVYNLIAVPVAVAGLCTPLLAAVLMAASSLTVIVNALRLNWMKLEVKSGGMAS